MSHHAVFWDASAFIALLNRRDRWHQPAVALASQLASENRFRVTTSAVMTEVANGLAKVPLRSKVPSLIQAWEYSAALGRTEVIHVDEQLWWRGFELYKERADKEWGLTDCLSFVVMRERGIEEAFTADHHFAQAGFQRLLF